MKDYLTSIEEIKKKYTYEEPHQVRMSNKDVIIDLANQISEYHDDDISEYSYPQKMRYIEEHMEAANIPFGIGRAKDMMQSNNSHTFAKYQSYVCSAGDSELLQKIRKSLISAKEDASEQLVPGLDVPFNSIFVGEKAENMVVEYLRQAFKDKKDFHIFTNYRHTDSAASLHGNSSENDIIILCPKGIFTIEVKGGYYKDYYIYSNGDIYSKPFQQKDQTAVTQQVEHMVSLINLLTKHCNRTSNPISAVVRGMVVLTNCENLMCSYRTVRAYKYSDLGKLVYGILSGITVFTHEEVNNIASVLNDYKAPSIKFEYTKKYSNYYAYYNEISKLEESWIVDDYKNVLAAETIRIQKENRTNRLKNLVLLPFRLIIIIFKLLLTITALCIPWIAYSAVKISETTNPIVAFIMAVIFDTCFLCMIFGTSKRTKYIGLLGGVVLIIILLMITTGKFII